MIAKFHRAMLERAHEAIDLVPAAERDVSSLTFVVGEDGLRRLKERVQRFRQEIIGPATQEQRGTRSCTSASSCSPCHSPERGALVSDRSHHERATLGRARGSPGHRALRVLGDRAGNPPLAPAVAIALLETGFGTGVEQITITGAPGASSAPGATL